MIGRLQRIWGETRMNMLPFWAMNAIDDSECAPFVSLQTVVLVLLGTAKREADLTPNLTQ
jgi:hypothetical protein